MNTFADLRTMEFESLSTVKARLSEFIRKLIPGQKRVAVTSNGKPLAVLMAYEDYLSLLSKLGDGVEIKKDNYVPRVIDLNEWQKRAKNRDAVLKSVANLFDVSLLSRKGQKAYKRETVRGFDRRA